jgi:hypothetical protein
MTARYDPTGRQTVNHRTHVITTPDGGKRTIEMTSRAPVLEIREYMRFLNDAGFDVRVFSGYGERPDDGESREVCFVCTLRR